jgi:ADP-heptose:LPS heptosyltransferase
LTTAKENPRADGPYRYTRRRWHVVFAAIDRVGTLAMTAGRTLARLFGKRPLVGGSAPGQDAKVILLIQLDRLGDAIITTAMLPLLRRNFPDASIEVLAARWNCDLFRAAPQVDHVHVSSVNRFADGLAARLGWIPSTFWWGWKLRRRKVDLGIDVRGEFPMALILWLCGARRRLGWDCGGGRFLLTDSPEYVPNRPELESRMALLAELDIESSALGWLDPPEFTFDEKARRRIAEQL